MVIQMMGFHASPQSDRRDCDKNATVKSFRSSLLPATVATRFGLIIEELIHAFDQNG